MSRLREAAEQLSRAWRGASLAEMIVAVHAMDDALAEERLNEFLPEPYPRKGAGMNQDLWEQLEGYQDLADAAGVGEEWRALCAEKTMMAAFACLKKTTEAKIINFEDATSWIISAISANAACLVQAVAAFRENGRQG